LDKQRRARAWFVAANAFELHHRIYIANVAGSFSGSGVMFVVGGLEGMGGAGGAVKGVDVFFGLSSGKNMLNS
jgi:hypothetical protein